MDPTPPARGSCSSGGLHPDNDEELCGQKASQLPGFFRKSKRNFVGLAPACADPIRARRNDKLAGATPPRPHVQGAEKKIYINDPEH